MKKTLIVLFFVVAALVLVSGQSYAAPCSNCHTMHNSQNGAPVDAAGPNPVLLVGSCLGCHAQNTAANVVTGIPQVRHLNATDLAGGNFNDVIGDQTFGHNVTSGALVAADGILGNTPPGGVAMAGALTCAGTNGCHGNRSNAVEMTDIAGTHHGNNVAGTRATGASLALSYRFLNGVEGMEVANWINSGPANHNEYVSGGASGISTFCASCHTNFHEQSRTAGDWLRHPVSFALNGGVASIPTSYGTGANSFDVNLPLARAAGVSTFSTDAAAANQVMCLTCHIAHGSPYADAIRFDYSAQGTGGAGAGAGCNKCHNK